LSAASVGSRQPWQARGNFDRRKQSASERGTHAFRKIIDIVKAGLAGSHNRLIHTTLKTDRINSHIRI
jgi:hypothetical protein